MDYVTWNHPRPEAGIAARIAAHAARTPAAPAVADADQTVTYGALNQKANRIAHYLRGLGVGPEVRVGLCLPRSVDFVVSALGVLKAGGAYVPLDPAHPAERLAYMLADAQAPALLTRAALLPGLPATDIPTLCLDRDGAILAAQPADEINHPVTPDNLAYMIYTSGSTGRPKGVAVPYRGLANLIGWTTQEFAVTAQDRATLIAGVGFDAAVWEIWSYLTHGASIAIPDEATRGSAVQLRDWLVAQQITIGFLPTPLAELVLTLDWPVEAPLRFLQTGGDRLQQAPPPGRPFTLFNNYGPTESSVIATAGPVHPGTTPDIGRPITNTEAILLDTHLRPVAPGEAGELYLGGAGLARGYHNQPALTAERFIPHPCSPVPGARVYRTGDLARWRDDGTLEFLGRIDTQVKVRGFRIELGEIEAVLYQHSAVRAAAVIAREDQPGDTRLVGYVVPQDGADTMDQTDHLRAFLRDRLPAYMVPGAFVFLETLPLTPNGKIDRRALPSPAAERPATAAAFVAPRTPVEEMLATVWREVLRLERVGIHDNFFDLGGQSLLATRVVSRLEQLFQTRISQALLFEQPTIAGLAQALAGQQGTTALAPITPADRSRPLPLAFAQQRLWFFDQYVPDSPLYNVAAVFQIAGTLDTAALEWSLNAVIGRHEALRTTFAEVDGQPVQVITPWAALALPVVDLRSLPEAERQTQAQRLMQDQARQPFDLRKGPLVRALLIQTDDDAYHLLLVIHHIACDGWSMGVLLEELGALYGASVEGPTAPPAPLPLQYADVAQWQQEQMHGAADLEKHLAYWQTRLGHDAPVLELPTDRPRPATQTFRGARLAHPLPSALIESLEQLGQREQASLFMVLLAGFQTLLYRYSGQTDLVVGAPIANRTRPEVERLIGMFVNTLPLRVDLAGNPAFTELVGRVRQAALEAYAHQDLPLERLVEALGIERQASHNPLFQVLFAVQNMALPPIRRPEMQMEFAGEVDTGTAKFDLSLYVDFPAGGPVLNVEYSTDLFDAATIARMMHQFQTLLEGVAAAPATPLAALPLLPAAERQQIVQAWNAATVPYPAQATMATLVEAQVARTPTALALVVDDQQFTYADLDARANRLAHMLRANGVGPEVRVGVRLARTPDLVVALLAILKAGGAYVPIDPAYPADRQAFMLADSRAVLLLTHAATGTSVEGSILVLDLDAITDEVAAQPVSAPPALAGPANLAYLIYTSGSTGTPKGVMITHHNAVAFLAWCRQCFTPAELAGVAAGTSICFDLSVFEIFAPLTGGGTVLLAASPIVPPAVPPDHPITLLNTVPSAISALLEAGAIPPTVQTVNLAGEPLPGSLVQQLYALPHIQRVFNLYGPSEDTTYSTWALMARDEARPPIGRPIANTQAYILDAHGQPAPIGVPGEVYLGGDGLARGYLDRPALTAEKFVPDSFSATPGARLYRTGDLARWRPDGQLEFLGRRDHQVKIRGFRIEPGEIAAVLARHPAVRESLVVVAPDARGDKTLVAYLVAAPEMTVPPVRELRAFLHQHLPEYMIPAQFVALAAWPLTPNGKINRKALPAPDASDTASEDTFVAPRTALETLLAQIWGQVLTVERIGVDDNFFDLGGHSLLATQVLSRVRGTFRVEVPLRALFETPTLAGFAAALIAREAKPGQMEQIAALLQKVGGLPNTQLKERLLQRRNGGEAA